jgi:hypothetical protein
MNAPSVDGHSDAPAAREVEQIVDHFLALFGPTRSRNSRGLYVGGDTKPRSIALFQWPFAGPGRGVSRYKKQLDRIVAVNLWP